MQTRLRNMFTTVRTEGALLPPDMLLRITDGDKDVPGLQPEDYHLVPGEKLNEAISRSWARLTGVWAAFRARIAELPEGERAVGLTRERWLSPLFQELGYGQLQTARAVEIDSKRYEISHLWGSVPFNLQGVGVPLDRRSPGVPGAATSSPHSLIQELLNRTDDYLWAFVSNGYRLRLLRDNSSLTRPAYVEFDLQAMMDGDVYPDFVLLWLLCHQSRVEGEKLSDFWVEKWSRLAQERGTRALELLRKSVEDAIKALGKGFVDHPANGALRHKLQAGELSSQEYYRQLLRMVYRLLFLFAAEDRDLLLDPDADSGAKERYRKYYSTARLRGMAQRNRGTRHTDLFNALIVMMTQLSDTGCPELALPALNSFLFANGPKGPVCDLEGCQLSNSYLLLAVRNLAFTTVNSVRRPVDYKNMGAEELGSVYESLLELHPEVNVEGRTFELLTASGNERKTTGSYYTPTSLINALLDSALNPVLDEAVRKPDPERAILDLEVCDPACGSGHFLVAAAHRIAKRLASVRTGDDEPSLEATRTALRHVVGRCIYGVDINPMAVELCKVSLWMEALEPGKPLSFLEHHIKVGNSLLGATPALLAKGIPDEAFEPIEGDERDLCREYRNKNRQERAGQRDFHFDILPIERLGNLSAGMMSLDEMADDTVEEIHDKQELYASLVNSGGFAHEKLWADAWCAAFVWKKRKSKEGGDHPITQGEFRLIEQKGLYGTSEWRKGEINRLAEQYGFFHWHLEFPLVFRVPGANEHPTNEQTGWIGGFDAVIGNPPWERTAFEDSDFFASRDPHILTAATTSQRKLRIAALETSNPTLFFEYQEARRKADGEGHLYINTGRYPLGASGRINTYALFADLDIGLTSVRGKTGVIVQTSIATDAPMEGFWRYLLESRRLVSIIDFENRKRIFPSVHQEQKFCLLTVAGSSRSDGSRIRVGFWLTDPAMLADTERVFELPLESLRIINPNTQQPPVCRTHRDFLLLTRIQQANVIMTPKDGSQIVAKAWPALVTAGSSEQFTELEELGAGKLLENGSVLSGKEVYIPLLEAKQVHQFDYTYATYEGTTAAERRAGEPRLVSSPERSASSRPLPRFWAASEVVERMYTAKNWTHLWALGVRDVTNVNNERTAIMSVLPRVGMIQPLNGVSCGSVSTAVMTVGAINSYALDYVARQKIAGRHLNVTIFSQLPAPLSADNQLKELIQQIVLELTYTAWDLEPFARDCGYYGPPFVWEEERRFLLRCELDAAYFHLYGIARDDMDYIMETFPIVKRKDEAQHGEYRTKRVILEIYDAMQQATETGTPYQTLLDPPPADPRVAHPADTRPDWLDRVYAARSTVAATGPAAPTGDGKVAVPQVQTASAVPAKEVVRPQANTSAQPARSTLTSTATPPGNRTAPVFGSTPAKPQQQSFYDLPLAPAASSFTPGDRVRHATFGEGQVLEVQPSGEDQILTVQFKTAGKRRLMAKAARLEQII